MAGYDVLDVDACTERNIYVSHVEKMVDAVSFHRDLSYI